MKRIILIILLLGIIGGLIYLNTFELKEIKINGCDIVSEEEVRAAIEELGYMDNTAVLMLKYKTKDIRELPFVSKIDIELTSKNKVLVTVYEKSMAGCVEYMDYYIYFDKDGIILDSSSKMIEGVPCIQGLNVNQWEIGEKMPIENEDRFQSILAITQLIEKYELIIDGIKFTAGNEIVLTHGGISIELGEGEYLAVQMMNLGSILEGLEGMEGTLYMKDFDSDNATASFSKKK